MSAARGVTTTPRWTVLDVSRATRGKESPAELVSLATASPRAAGLHSLGRLPCTWCALASMPSPSRGGLLRVSLRRRTVCFSRTAELVSATEGVAH